MATQVRADGVKRTCCVPKAVRRVVIARDTLACDGIPTCAYCGRTPVEDEKMQVQVDHIKPWVLGGSCTDLLNLVTCCGKCNRSFGGRPKPAHIAAAVRKLAKKRTEEMER